jgi:hypothetical protein
MTQPMQLVDLGKHRFIHCAPSSGQVALKEGGQHPFTQWPRYLPSFSATLTRNLTHKQLIGTSLWTIVHVIIFIAQIVLTIFATYKKSDDDTKPFATSQVPAA